MVNISMYAPKIQQRLALPEMRQTVCRAITNVRRYPYTNVAVADQFGRSISWPLAEMTGRHVDFDKPVFCADVLEGMFDPDNLGKDMEGTFDISRYSSQIGELRSVNTAFSVVGAIIREVLIGQEQAFVSAVSEGLTFPALSGFIKETNQWLKQTGDELYPDSNTTFVDQILGAANRAFQVS